MLGRLLNIILIAFLCTSCGPRSLKDYREQGHAITRSLIKELQSIHNYDELIAKRARLTELFNELVDAMSAARTYQLQHPKAEALELTDLDHHLSDQLRAEMNRLYQIEGGRALIESCQREALRRL